MEGSGGIINENDNVHVEDIIVRWSGGVPAKPLGKRKAFNKAPTISPWKPLLEIGKRVQCEAKYAEYFSCLTSEIFLKNFFSPNFFFFSMPAHTYPLL